MMNEKGSDMTLREEELLQIGTYVRRNLPNWLADIPFTRHFHERDLELRERIVRVEEELKSQRADETRF